MNECMDNDSVRILCFGILGLQDRSCEGRETAGGCKGGNTGGAAVLAEQSPMALALLPRVNIPEIDTE